MTTQVLSFTVLGLLFLGYWYYTYRSHSIGSAKMAKHYGLTGDERVSKMWLGELDTTISLADRAATAAVGLVSGALLGGIGIATLRALGATALLTTKRRLVLVLERPDNRSTIRHFFGTPSE